MCIRDRFYSFAAAGVHTEVKSSSTVTFAEAFKNGSADSTGAGVNVGNGLGWTDKTSLGADYPAEEDGWVNWFVNLIGWRSKTIKGHTAVEKSNEQERLCAELAGANSQIIPALFALNHVVSLTNELGEISFEGLNGIKGKAVGPTVRVIQSKIGGGDLFGMVATLIDSLFPVPYIPAERARKNMSKIKISESPYQIKGTMAQGARIIYMPRSSKSLMYRDSAETDLDDRRDLIWGVITNLQEGDTFKVSIVRHFEGVPHPQFAPYLQTTKVMPDQKTLEQVDRIASINPDLLVIPPGEVERTFNAIKEQLGFLAGGGTAAPMSKTDEVLTKMVQYEQETDV